MYDNKFSIKNNSKKKSKYKITLEDDLEMMFLDECDQMQFDKSKMYFSINNKIIGFNNHKLSRKGVTNALFLKDKKFLTLNSISIFLSSYIYYILEISKCILIFNVFAFFSQIYKQYSAV